MYRFSLDEPLIWGTLPIRYGYNAYHHRWTLGAHDVCFKNAALSSFFAAGQVLPTYRCKHSPHGGIFQPTVSHAIKLLSSSPSPPSSPSHPYQPGGLAWVHVFAEGRVNQHCASDLRYFKWGLSRLILESEPMPDVVPMFIDGFQQLMPEDRAFPRFVPRIGARIRVAFGDRVDPEHTFGELRHRWQALVARAPRAAAWPLGELPEEEHELRGGDEVRALRIDVARRARDEVLKLRANLGYPVPDPRLGLAEAWAEGEKR